ncbi:MAG: excisionase family DNA-binding protein [Acidimicrobiales bacterium]|nr:excisionase family DNA-binding protein [Acidimicrobiales bacterium]
MPDAFDDRPNGLAHPDTSTTGEVMDTSPARTDLLTEEEAAAVLRSDTGHVRRLVRQRRLAVVRDGHWIRIPLADVEQFLEHARIEAEGA